MPFCAFSDSRVPLAVLGVREELLTVLQPEQTHAGSLRGAPLQMRLLQ